MAAVAAPVAPGALSPRQRRALDAICDTFHPGTAELGAADAFLELFGSQLRPAELRRLLGLLSVFGVRRFDRLSQERRERILLAWCNSRLVTRRAAFHGLRKGKDLIVVAQSMAAFVAPMLCERVDVQLLILVAPMIPSPGESPGAWWSNTGQTTARRQQDEREGRDPDAAFDVMTIFMHDVPPDIVAEAFARGEPRQSDTPFAEPWPLKEWPSVPTRVLAGRHDRLLPLEFMRRLALDRLSIVADVIDSGHLPALSRPDELVHRLETYRLQRATLAG